MMLWLRRNRMMLVHWRGWLVGNGWFMSHEKIVWVGKRRRVSGSWIRGGPVVRISIAHGRMLLLLVNGLLLTAYLLLMLLLLDERIDFRVFTCIALIGWRGLKRCYAWLQMTVEKAIWLRKLQQKWKERNDITERGKYAFVEGLSTPFNPFQPLLCCLLQKVEFGEYNRTPLKHISRDYSNSYYFVRFSLT